MDKKVKIDLEMEEKAIFLSLLADENISALGGLAAMIFYSYKSF